VTKKCKRVRIVCRDDGGAVLLMKWRDPTNGNVFWEPPGGGIEGRESCIEAARRELYEETGLTLELPEEFIRVERDYEWCGKRYRHTEAFFRVVTDRVDVALTSPTSREIATLVEMRFIPIDELDHLLDPLEPPSFASIVRSVT
jgi:8-oxo-dGTP pyrophosphatase MutT (NUDIX family)